MNIHDRMNAQTKIWGTKRQSLMAAHWWPQPAGLTLAAGITWCQGQWYRGSKMCLVPNLTNCSCLRWRLIEKVHCVECLGSTLGMIARYCWPPETFDLSVLLLETFSKAGAHHLLHAHHMFERLQDKKIISCEAIPSPIFNSHGSAGSWVITSHSSSLHPVGNRTWTKSSMTRKHKKNAEHSLTIRPLKGHLPGDYLWHYTFQVSNLDRSR